MPVWLQFLGMFLGGSLVTAAFSAWANRHKTSAEVTKLFADTAAGLVKESNAQINGLRDQYTEINARNSGLIAEIGRLEGMIERLEREVTIKNVEADSMRDEIKTLRKELVEKDREIERQLAEKDREIEALECENVLLKERVSQLEQRLEKLVGERDQE